MTNTSRPWIVETVRADGAVLDTDDFSDFMDAWAYSRFDTIGRGWRFHTRPEAQQFFETNTDSEPMFVAAWIPGRVSVRIRRGGVSGWGNV